MPLRNAGGVELTPGGGSRLRKTVLVAIAALALPAGIQAESRTQHHFTHIGSGVTIGPTFHVRGETRVHWRLEWRCPAGNYGFHVNLEAYGQIRARGGWGYEAKIYAYNPPNHHPEGVGASGSELVRPGFLHQNMSLRMSFHASSECHYGLHAWWNV
jgi:hypothetical protein